MVNILNVLGVTFGLDISGIKDVCGSDLHTTQVSNIFVTWRRESYIRGADFNPYVDRLDNIIGLLSHNWISRTKVFGTAIQEIAMNTCNNGRDVVKNKIEILRNHPQSGNIVFFTTKIKYIQ